MTTDDTIDLDALHRWLNDPRTSAKYPYAISDEKYGAIQGHLTKLFGEERRKFLSWAFDANTPEERKTLSQSRRAALWQWLSPQHDSDLNVWLIRDQCHRTAKALLRQWQVEAGQASLFETASDLEREETK